jgi:hypothetical protein
MSAATIFEHTRPTEWPAPEGTTVTVVAKCDSQAVTIRWQRSDLESAQLVTLTLEEFQGIAAALGYPRQR